LFRAGARRDMAGSLRPRATVEFTVVLLALASPRGAAGWHASPRYLTTGLSHSRPPLRSTAPVTVRGSEAAGSEAAGSDSGAITTAVRKLNSSTKWLVTIAQTGAVWSRRDFVSPFLVLGAILSAFATGTLKELINESRPDGAPFADPGMPSSHALVSTFAAAGWALHLRSTVASALLLSGALSVSVLRVVCGYHTWAQVTVGTVLGAAMARGWMSLGAVINAHVPARAAFIAVWLLYLCGSAVFIRRKMRSWFGKDAAL